MRVSGVERRRVARLFHRAGFGADVATIDTWAAKGYRETVEYLLAVPRASGRLDDVGPVGEQVRGNFVGALLRGDEGIRSYQTWWLRRMAETDYPLEEKLTLYWHGHFATSYTKVHNAGLMIRQNRLLRDHALGDFRAFCNEITADAAMLVWLDGTENAAGKINENYGREFMELFTLGTGHYSQRDVVEAARSFTGYVTDGNFGSNYDPVLHDKGQKTLLGHTGKWGAADVTDIVLDRHPEGDVAAHYVARRLGGFLYRPNPERAVVEAMAGSFIRARRFDIKAMVRTLLLRREFSDGPARTLKAPVELVAGVMRALFNGRGGFGDEFADYASSMGQRLFQPPDVSGWKGGLTWANTATVLARYNFAALAANNVTGNVVTSVLDAAGGVPRKTAKPWMDRLGLLELSSATQAGIAQYLRETKGSDDIITRGVLTLILASADYNLR